MRFPKSLIVLVIALSACVPTEVGNPVPSRIDTGVITNSALTFYPSATGLSWTYLPVSADGAINPDSPTFELRIEGQRVFKGKAVTGVRFFGRAGDRTFYRDYDANGVHLLGWNAPDVVTVTYDPPLLEYPTERQLRQRGFSWSNDSKVTTSFPRKADVTTKITEKYTVLGTEKYKVGNATFDTIVINYEGSLSSGERLTSVIYFAPKIGEVRTKEGLILFRKNF